MNYPLKNTNKGAYSMRHTRLRAVESEMIENLKKWIEENGRTPSRKDFARCNYLNGYSTYCYKFGTIVEALKLAGYEFDETGKELVEKEDKGSNVKKKQSWHSEGLKKILYDIELAIEMKDREIFLRKLRNLKLYSRTEKYKREGKVALKESEFILTKYSKILAHIKI
jgi:hypothetical protein